ncbi:MAG TPA: hypothetical protein VFM46_06600 [Pseudomonadales bacterium]|nr:hypothetical protein [Pseudomonadales bacterium]
MNQLVNGIITILAAVVGVAILSVIVSKNSNTTEVIKAGSQGFSAILGAAEAPVTGSSMGGWSGTW